MKMRLVSPKPPSKLAVLLLSALKIMLIDNRPFSPEPTGAAQSVSTSTTTSPAPLDSNGFIPICLVDSTCGDQPTPVAPVERGHFDEEPLSNPASTSDCALTQVCSWDEEEDITSTTDATLQTLGQPPHILVDLVTISAFESYASATPPGHPLHLLAIEPLKSTHSVHATAKTHSHGSFPARRPRPTLPSVYHERKLLSISHSPTSLDTPSPPVRRSAITIRLLLLGRR